MGNTGYFLLNYY